MKTIIMGIILLVLVFVAPQYIDCIWALRIVIFCVGIMVGMGIVEQIQKTKNK